MCMLTVYVYAEPMFYITGKGGMSGPLICDTQTFQHNQENISQKTYMYLGLCLLLVHRCTIRIIRSV